MKPDEWGNGPTVPDVQRMLADRAFIVAGCGAVHVPRKNPRHCGPPDHQRIQRQRIERKKARRARLKAQRRRCKP